MQSCHPVAALGAMHTSAPSARDCPIPQDLSLCLYCSLADRTVLPLAYILPVAVKGAEAREGHPTLQLNANYLASLALVVTHMTSIAWANETWQGWTAPGSDLVALAAAAVQELTVSRRTMACKSSCWSLKSAWGSASGLKTQGGNVTACGLGYLRPSRYSKVCLLR